VLDDSTDETQACSRADGREAAREGVDISYIHRVDRTGYKAGALDAGLAVAKGELVAIFDADFIPQPSFLRARSSALRRPEGRHGADALGPHEPRRVAPDARAGPHARRPPPRREPRALRRRAPLQLLGHRRHVAQSEAIYSTPAAGSTTRSPRTSTLVPRPARGLALRLPRGRGHARRAPRGRLAFRAQQFRWAKGTVQTSRKLHRRVLTASRLTVDAAHRGVLPHDAALRVPAHGAAQRAPLARAAAHAGDRRAR
jgi:cellulose synthase/poly-beta-1,6-N-acetylglucosamine synthase-like glycosyltransferase